MKRFIPIVLLIVGCGQSVGTKATAPAQPEFTSDADLIAWKDAPEKFKGKTFRINAKYVGAKPLRQTPKRAGFSYSARSQRGDYVDHRFLVEMDDKLDLPNLDDFDKVVIEFVCREGEHERGNFCTSISR